MEKRSRREILRTLDSPNRVSGYVATFGTPTVITDIGGRQFREVIARGAFTDALKTNDVRVLYNHNTDWVLGRTGAGTARVWEDEVGLAFEVDLPNDPQGEVVRSKVARGDIDGGSFAWDTQEDVWSDYEGMPSRELRKVNVVEISIVTFPAYPGTTIDIRSQRQTPLRLLKAKLALQELSAK